MKIQKAVITAAGPDQRKLPVQTLIDRDGTERSVLEILIREAISAGIDQVGVVIHPDDEKTYRNIAGPEIDQVEFIHQAKPLGYGHAILSARSFTGKDPFLHLVGDHLYVNRDDISCARKLVEFAANEECTVSAVQATRESLIPHYGVIGGSRMQGKNEVYKIDKVIEKPTPTVAEQQLLVPGLRAGHYLCFFGMHVLTFRVMEILGQESGHDPVKKLNLSDALDLLSSKEKYLGYEIADLRFDMGEKYGLLKAQLALSLGGKDRDKILSELLELFIQKDMDKQGR